MYLERCKILVQIFVGIKFHHFEYMFAQIEARAFNMLNLLLDLLF